MWEIIAAAALCVFSIIGFVAFVRALIFLIYKPKNENAYIVFKGNETSPSDIEYTLRSWAARAKWLGRTAPDSIIIVDSGLDDESREICRLICRENELFKICTPVELYKIFH